MVDALTTMTSVVLSINSFKSRLKRDPRDYQIFFLGTLLLSGVFFLNWQGNILQYLAYLGGACLTQSILIKVYKLPLSSIKSAIISGLGLCLLLHTNHWGYAALGGILAIASKSLFRYKNKHVFNPANFAIVALLLFGNQSWVSPGQWGQGGLIMFWLIVAAAFILNSIKRLDTSLTFLGTLFVLEYCRTVFYLGWEPAVVIHSFSNGSLLLFTFFMISDPMTSPNHRVGRMIWSILLAVAVFSLSRFLYVQTAVMWCLFFMCLITPFLDHKFISQKLEWHHINK